MKTTSTISTQSPHVPGRTSARKRGVFKLILTLMALAVMGLTDVFAHGVQVGYCQLSNGYIRIFVEHWHGNLSSPGQAGTMSITTTYGSTSVTQNLTPTGVINNTSYNNLSGCGSSISIISSCSGQANTYNDWVYYDFAPAACGVPVTIRLNAGNTVVLTEACSNLYPATVTANFSDNAPPIITTSNVTVNGCGGNTVTFSQTVNDACDPNPTVTYSPASGSTFSYGTTQVTVTATDNANHTSTAYFNVVVQDNVNPTISCVGSANRNTDDGECTYMVSGTELDPTSTGDNCGVQSVTNNYNNSSSLDGAIFNTGTTVVTWTVTDVHGNTSTCTTSVTVTDNEDPVIEGENVNLTTTFDAGSGAPPSYTENGITFLSLYGSGSHVHLGDNNYDGSNDLLNHSGCCSTPYRLTVGNNVSFTLVSMEVKSVSGNPTFYVYPSGASVTITSTGTFTFPSGFANVTEVRWHQPSGTMIIDNVIVSTKTSGSCPQDITVDAEDDACGAYVTYSATASDNCTASVSFSPASGSFFSVGTTTVTTTATDASGNTSTCSFDVTVEDNQNPTITCAGNQSRNVASGTCSYTASGSEFDPTSTGDNCTVASVINDYNNSSTLSGAVFGLGNTTVTWTVTDNSGNTSTCSETITVVDNQNPSITCVGNQTRDADGGCTYTASGTEFDPTATADNCSVASVTNDYNNGSSLANAVFNLGSTTVTWTVTDGSGNTSSCSYTVTVEDNIDPTITCASSQTVDADNGSCTYAVNGTGFDPSSTGDNCSIASVTNNYNNSSSLNGAVFNLGTTTVTWTITDGSGNTASCSHDVTVQDSENPAISCVGAQSRTADAGNCSYATQGSEFDPTSATDNCSVASVSNDYNNSASLNGASFNVGTTTVVWTVTDGSGNTATCSTDITVTDDELPSVSCQNATVTLSSGSATVSVSDVLASSSDNCGIAGHSLDITSFDCDDIGTHTVTLTATDVHGNSNTCNATVTVVGAVPSCTITSSANTSGNVIGSTTTYAATNQMFLGYGPQSMNISCSASGGNSFSYSWSGSGLSSTNVSNPVFTPSQGGNYTLTCTVTNDYGCETTCSITICVIDVQASGGSAKNPKVIVCHVPAGNKGNPQTISISVNAVSAHLGYHGGCTLGPCGYDCDDNKNYKRSVANADIHHMEGADQDIELMVFPNPSHDGFNLLLESPDDDLMTVAIYDISGRLILDSDQVQPNDVFEFGDKFPVGVYVVRVNQNSATKTIRIIKTDQ